MRNGLTSELGTTLDAYQEGRPSLTELSVDRKGTWREEDTYSAVFDGSDLLMSSSVMDIGAVDPNCSLPKSIAGQLAAGKTTPRISLISTDTIERMSFRHNRPMPAISAMGPIDVDDWAAKLTITPTTVKAISYDQNSEDLPSNELFRNAFLAAVFLGADINLASLDKTPDENTRIRNANLINEVLGKAFNLAMAEFVLVNELPVIGREFPIEVRQFDGRLTTVAGFKAGQSDHAEFRSGVFLARKPCTNLEATINLDIVSYFLRHKRSPISFSEASLIAGWLTRERIAAHKRSYKKQALAHGSVANISEIEKTAA